MSVEIKETVDRNKKPYFTITSDKYKSDFIVRKTEDGYQFYEVAASKATLPKALEGRYLTPEDAIKKVKEYLNGVKKTAAKRRDETYEENHPLGPTSKSNG